MRSMKGSPFLDNLNGFDTSCPPKESSEVDINSGTHQFEGSLLKEGQFLVGRPTLRHVFLKNMSDGL